VKTGAYYVDSRDKAPTFLLRCTNGETQEVETRTLYRTSTFGPIESVGQVKSEMVFFLRELNPANKKDAQLIAKGEEIQRGRARRSQSWLERIKN